MAGFTIADTPEALTPGWLTEALTAGGHLNGAQVIAAELTPVGTGQMCDSLRATLTYDAVTEAPQTLVAKLPAGDQISRDTAKSLRSYESEVRFYQQLAPELAVRTPAVFHADIDAASASFILLLEDLSPAEVGDQLAGCSPERAAAAVDELVGLHAPHWDDPWLEDLEWLHKDPEANRTFLAGLLPDLWSGFRERYAADLGAEVHRAGDELFARLDAYLGADTRPWTAVHGDYRLDNLLFRSGADDTDRTDVAVVDWQTCAHGPALSDVAYCVGASLQPDQRREVETDLVRSYHDGLVAAGVSDYDFDRCWDDYRRGTWSGLVMAVAASMLVTRTDRGDQMFRTMADRHARHALDLDAADTLGG